MKNKKCLGLVYGGGWIETDQSDSGLFWLFNKTRVKLSAIVIIINKMMQ